jgi:hypothetical protein
MSVSVTIQLARIWLICPANDTDKASLCYAKVIRISPDLLR